MRSASTIDRHGDASSLMSWGDWQPIEKKSWSRWTKREPTTSRTPEEGVRKAKKFHFRYGDSNSGLERERGDS